MYLSYPNLLSPLYKAVPALAACMMAAGLEDELSRSVRRRINKRRYQCCCLVISTLRYKGRIYRMNFKVPTPILATIFHLII